MKRISLTGWFVTFSVTAFLLWAVFVLTSDLTYVPDDQDETVERCDTPITNAAGGDYERRVTATYEPVEINRLRDANTRVYKVVKDVEETDVDTGAGTVTQVESRIIEKGSNLCYRNSLGNWEVTDATFEPVEGGFRMDKNNFELELGETLAGPVKFTTSGKSIELTLSHFIISDGFNTQQVGSFDPDVRGALDEGDSSKLRFANAFGDNIADVEYVVENGGFHQNIIINDTISAPVGFDEFNTKLYVYTEINLDDFMNIQGGSVTVRGEAVDAVKDLLLADAGTIDLIDLTAIVDGEEELISFFAESEIIDGEGEKLYADRQLFRDPSTGKVYLVESIALNDLSECVYPVVWDYVERSGTISGNEVWTAKDTYYVIDDVTITGEVKIEPGTVIKIEDDKSIFVGSGGKIIAEGEPYNYIVFTSKNDDDSGDEIGGSSGDPAARDYDEAINMNGASTASRISYCKIAYADKGLRVLTCQMTSPIENNIITQCRTGIAFLSSSSNEVTNNLITNCTSNGIDIAALEGTYNLYNNTIDSCGKCINVYGDMESSAPDVNISETIVSNWTTNGIRVLYGADMDVDYVAYYPNQTSWKYGFTPGSNNIALNNSPYSSSTIGGYYIDAEGNGSSLVEAGDRTASAAGLDSDEFSYLAPDSSYANETIDENTHWVKYADTDYGSTTDVTIGYHHNRIDYVVGNGDVEFVNSSSAFEFVIDSGVVTAMYSTGTDTRIRIRDKCSFTCVGDPENEEYPLFTNKKAVSMSIETPHPSTDDEFGPRIENANGTNSIRYAVFAGLVEGLRYDKEVYPDDVDDVELRDCVFRANYDGLSIRNDFYTANHLCYYNYSGIDVNDADASPKMVNLTCDQNTYGLSLTSWSSAIVGHCALTGNDDGINVTGGDAEDFDEDYNCYYGNDNDVSTGWSPAYTIGSNSLVAESSIYEDSWSGFNDQWYMDQSMFWTTTCETRGCIDAGPEETYEAGFKGYVTNINGTPDGDDLDIGYHYPRVFKDLYVDSCRGKNTNNGTSANTPFKTIPYAIGEIEDDYADYVVRLHVAPGLYHGDLSNPDDPVMNLYDGATFSCLSVIGEDAKNTFIDGGGVNDSMVYIEDAVDMKFENLTFLHGWVGHTAYACNGAGIYADNSELKVVNCIVRDTINATEYGGYGGGIYANSGVLEVSDCVFAGNVGGQSGAGIYAKEDNELTVENCSFMCNSGGSGAGIYSTGGSCKVLNCMFAGNESTGDGGGICTYADDSTIRDCVFIKNSDGHAGAGIYVKDDTIIERCLFRDNSADRHGAGINFAMSYSDESIVSNCVFVDNEVRANYDNGHCGGAAISNDGYSGTLGRGTVKVINCTMKNNVWPSFDYGTQIRDGNSSGVIEVYNCIVWDDDDDAVNWSPICGGNLDYTLDTPEVYYSDIGPKDDWDGINNCISQDPRIELTSLGTGHLRWTLSGSYNSPCIDVGSNDDVEGDYDFDGDARIMNTTVDMGADERERFRVVNKIEKYNTDEIQVTFNDEGSSYTAYYSDSDWGDNMLWTAVSGDPFTDNGDTQTFTDDAAESDTRGKRFYKIKYTSGGTTYETDAVGFFNVEVAQSTTADKTTYISIPLQTKWEKINENYDGETDGGVGSVGYMLGENMRGHTLAASADKLYILQSDQTWKRLWRDIDDTWHDDDGVATDPISRGNTYKVVTEDNINNTGSRYVTVLGWVPQLSSESKQYGSDDDAAYETAFGAPYPADINLDDANFPAFGTRGSAVENDTDDTDLVKVWNTSSEDWDEMWMHDNKYYLASNATSTTLVLTDASEFEVGWSVCVMNDEHAECVQIQSISSNTLTVTAMEYYASYTIPLNTFVYKFEPTRYDLDTTYVSGTSLVIGATPYFEAGDEIFITDGTNLEWDTIDSVSTNGTTTITLDNGFDNGYTTGNSSYIWSRPKFGRWRKVTSDGSNNDPWAVETEGLVEISPTEGVIIERQEEDKERSIVITRPYSRE